MNQRWQTGICNFICIYFHIFSKWGGGGRNLKLLQNCNLKYKEPEIRSSDGKKSVVANCNMITKWFFCQWKTNLSSCAIVGLQIGLDVLEVLQHGVGRDQDVAAFPTVPCITICTDGNSPEL